MATWSNAHEIVDKLVGALTAFDWAEAEAICRSLAKNLNEAVEPFPEKHARTVLKELRRKRQFPLMALVADALIGSGRTEAEIHRQYAQALIDQGNLNAAERMLQALTTDPATGPRELAEARGLLGRIYKQRYVDARQPESPKQQHNLRQAIAFYHDVYRTDPGEHLWHGINVVALLARGERDHIDLRDPQLNDFRDIARQILARLRDIEEQKGELSYWDRATSLEAHVALGQFDNAADDLREYMYDRNADAFECFSTLRQLREVWQIEKEGEPGALIANALQAALLKRSGGEVELQSVDVQRGLELNFSGVGDLTLDWWRMGLERCTAVARIEDLSGRRVGTGFLVRRKDFLADGADDRLLLTNWHVISEGAEHPLSIRPDMARANFEGCGRTYRISPDMVAFSRRLDASLVALEEFDGITGHCPLEPAPAAFSTDKTPRVYVIGYPGGRGLSFSVHDSIWLDTDGTLLHYRTPTEPGSSGSPVFDQNNWTLMGLHHAGRTNMQKLNGKPGTYEANEGIAIEAIRNTLRTSPKS